MPREKQAIISWAVLRPAFQKAVPLSNGRFTKFSPVPRKFGLGAIDRLWLEMDNRRFVDRTKTSKLAAISFGGQAGERFCDVEVRDLGSGGAGIYKPGLALLPTTFELSFDNLRRRCRMVWRSGNLFGVTFEDQHSPRVKRKLGPLTSRSKGPRSQY